MYTTKCLPLREGVDWNINVVIKPKGATVSLCVREWIEIRYNSVIFMACNVSLCVREWIEIRYNSVIFMACKSPSAWGSGLKLQSIKQVPFDSIVSLCVREWIEILYNKLDLEKIASPSAWGSGLKSYNVFSKNANITVSLCVREWIEILDKLQIFTFNESPSAWGSGLKLHFSGLVIILSCLPLREGVDWNSKIFWKVCALCVSLCVREWIEIISLYLM